MYESVFFSAFRIDGLTASKLFQAVSLSRHLQENNAFSRHLLFRPKQRGTFVTARVSGTTVILMHRTQRGKRPETDEEKLLCSEGGKFSFTESSGWKRGFQPPMSPRF